ncbi:hypothetical protein [Listeria rustica]|uniref:Uncharacterized protein n=1 Tax=Listeria rustica TaxID=2713503 RepID=A0A7W1T703_9LIST|nr:hypothetical protein [Listeria rustica]MBA3926564.1 hypothetical protein [Listeria rustica]
MKTGEFTQAVEKLGYTIRLVGRDKAYFRIYINDAIAAVIDGNAFMSSDTVFTEFEQLDDARKLELGSLIIKYACTPINEREGEAE